MQYYQRNGFGRSWTSSALGIQDMSQKSRHTLCQDKIHDIDMKNAHPTLLSWYCHDNGINWPGLMPTLKTGKSIWQIKWYTRKMFGMMDCAGIIRYNSEFNAPLPNS